MAEKINGKETKLSMPKVSIIIPCYNLGKYLDEAVESVLNQSFQDFEIIIVNDGSTDQFTRELLADYIMPKTTILNAKKNEGLPSARNNGIKKAKGAYICCLDADDYFHPQFLKKTVAVLDEDTAGKIGFVATWVQLVGDANWIWETADYNPFRLAVENGIHVASLFRRECWEEVGGFATNLGGYQDWDFWIAIAAKGYEWLTIREPLAYYRKRQDSMLKASERKDIELFGQIIENHREFYQDHLDRILIEGKMIIKYHVENRKWLASRNETLKDDLEKRDTVIADQQLYIERLQEAKDWLETEYKKWQTLAAERDTVIADQQLHIERLQEAKDWLETEYKKWQTLAGEQAARQRQLTGPTAIRNDIVHWKKRLSYLLTDGIKILRRRKPGDG